MYNTVWWLELLALLGELSSLFGSFFFLRGVEHEVGTGQGRQRSVHDVAGPSLVPRSYRHKD